MSNDSGPSKRQEISESFLDNNILLRGAYIIAVLFSLISLFYGIFPQPSIIPPAIHLMFALVLVLIIKQPLLNERNIRTIIIGSLDIIFLASSLYASLYLILNYQAIAESVGNLNNATLFAGGIIILAVLYVTGRMIGWALPIIATFFLIYAYFGRDFPGLFQHGGYSLERIIGHIFITEDGIYGTPLKTSASLVIFFLIFSAFYEKAGGGKFIIDMANAAFGKMRGGPAKVSVLASSFFGSISGSATANVVSTGALTIPMMKKLGYRPHFAGGVEAVSSTGGQLMPPIMGTAAFIMAEMLGVPYIEVLLAAIVPAILYYVAIFLVVHLEAIKLNIKGIDKSHLPSKRSVLRETGHMSIPLIVLVYFMVFLNFSPSRSALYALLVTIAVSYLRKQTRLTIPYIFTCLKLGSERVLQVALACACAGIVVGVFALTGLGLKLSHILIDLSGGSLAILLILTAITSIILGMGMPTVGAYLVLAILIAPVLIEMGVNPIAAHLFVFYFGNMSMITPPVALAAFAAAGIAGSNAAKTGWTASRLAIAAFILPFMFVYSEGLLLSGTIYDISIAVLTSLIGILLLSIGLQNFLMTKLSRLEQFIFVIASIFCILPNITMNLIGFVIGGIGMVIHFNRSKKLKGIISEEGSNYRRSVLDDTVN